MDLMNLLIISSGSRSITGTLAFPASTLATMFFFGRDFAQRVTLDPEYISRNYCGTVNTRLDCPIGRRLNLEIVKARTENCRTFRWVNRTSDSSADRCAKSHI